MRHLALSAAAALALAGGLLTAGPDLSAQDGPQVPGARNPDQVTAGTYAADPSHSLVAFKVNHFGFNNYFGIFGDVAGTLVLDPANLDTAKVDVTIPVASVTTASKGLTDHLLRAGKDGGAPDFFGPAPAPAHFVSTSVIVDGSWATITGDLTLNGVTRPITFAAEFTGAGINPFNKKETVGFQAEAKIYRSDFGVNYGIPFVGDEVELDISVAFEKQ